MNTPSTQQLLDRVARLERSARSSRRAIGAFALIIIALPLLAFATGTDEVSASRFTLVDAKGRTRGYWETAADTGDPKLVMLSAAGKEQIELSMKDVQTLFIMRNHEEQNRIGMAVDGMPHLMLHDQGQKPRMHVTIGPRGAPNVLFIHEDGTLPLGFGLKPDGTAWIKPDRWNQRLDQDKK